LDPFSLLIGDPNSLPYFVKETLAGGVVPVRFEPLAPYDEAELRGQRWSKAVFSEVWPKYVHIHNTFKLVLVQETQKDILGLVHVGRVMPASRFLKKSLLETVPSERYQALRSHYRGVGRVLIARLIVESYLQGGQGNVMVRPRPGTEPFYSALGFTPAPRLPRLYTLGAFEAETLLQRTLLETPELE
jgi:hypothetical protein